MQTLSTAKQRILTLYSELQAADSLAPSDTINRLFSELVEVSSSSSHGLSHALLRDGDIQRIIPSLRSLSSAGECELERYWATRILQSLKPATELLSFPYYSNYQKLTVLELRSLGLLRESKIQRALFVGSVPCPCRRF